jgi:small subunit ribosomal protein S8
MDIIADMLTIIRNAQAVKKETVAIAHSKLKMEILKVLVKEKFLKEAEAKGKKNKKIIDVVLAYDEKKNPAISHIKRISKTSKRVYLPVNKIKPVRRGLGAFIISTPRGILTDKEARREKVGGEILCEIW